MLRVSPEDYETFALNDQIHRVVLADHIGGFDQFLRFSVLDRLQAQANGRTLAIESEYIVDQQISSLSSADWHDLYQLESDTIEHNYDHYFSGTYLKSLDFAR